jgi:hypothetical protein
MTADRLLAKIKKKFGSLSAFAEIAGLDRYELQKHFARKKPDENITWSLNNKCLVLKPRTRKGEISPKQLKSLKRAINESGGVLAFTRENSEYSKDSIFQILSGKRKRMTPKVKKLFSHFELMS